MEASRKGIRRARATRPESVQPNSAKSSAASLGPCSRLTACQTPKLIEALLRPSHRPSDGLEFQNQLICGSPTDGGPLETGVFALLGEGRALLKVIAPDTALRHYHDSAPGSM